MSRLQDFLGRVDKYHVNTLVDGAEASTRRGGRFERPNQDFRLTPEQLAKARELGFTLLSERETPAVDYRPVTDWRCVKDPLIGEKLVVKASAASKWDGAQFSVPVPASERLRDAGAFKLASLLERL
jgi:hypothetical protein